MSADFIARDLKALLNAVTLFPTPGNFGGADLVAIAVGGGYAVATTFGVVLSRSRCRADGELDLIGLDRRTVCDYVGTCPETSKVTIAVEGTECILSRKTRKVTLAVGKAQEHKVSVTKELPSIKMTKDLAQRVRYLADIAFADTSRPELNCVMLGTGGRAIACNQRTIALMKTKQNGNVVVAVPLTLARILEDGAVLYVGKDETIVKNGSSHYSTPTPVAAVKNFPLQTVEILQKEVREEIAVIQGDKLAHAIQDCVACIGGLSRTDVVIDFSISGKRLYCKAKNGGATFEAVVPLSSAQEEVVEFKVPLEGLVSAVAFMADTVKLSRGGNGDLFLVLQDGWVLFPAWLAPKKKGA